jgi:hypothetical protein
MSGDAPEPPSTEVDVDSDPVGAWSAELNAVDLEGWDPILLPPPAEVESRETP